jgi:hypothetical protein
MTRRKPTPPEAAFVAIDVAKRRKKPDDKGAPLPGMDGAGLLKFDLCCLADDVAVRNDARRLTTEPIFARSR